MSDLTLTAVTASIGDLDTSDNLMGFEAYQKYFIVNGSNLKVMDFKNCELTHTALATAHLSGDILTQATSDASMIVEYTNEAKTKTYGYVTTGTFNTTNEVTGSGTGSAFTPSATDTGSPGGGQPHWYDWTPYQNDTDTYGSMPEKAYIGCLYRGRAVLSGNPNYPHQWYMSEVGDPFNWVYAENDSLAPVSGGNNRAGEIGDIVRALIPYQDEYLLFGCANSIWALRGDAADGGSLTPLNTTIGMFGNASWEFDSGMNLFFTSKNGIHRIPYGFGPIEQISQFVLPNLAGDSELDPTVHRVTMKYDRIREGILTTITTIADGSNVAYWYNLTTKGFYPEEYPNTCGAYSMHFYNSNDDLDRALLLGCTDGYLRRFDDSTLNDATTNGTTAIESYMTLPLMQVDSDDNNLLLNNIVVTTAGGQASGSASDTNSVDVEIYKGEDPETILEAIEDGDSPLHDVTVTGPGMANRIRRRARDRALAIRLSNDQSDSTWAIEKISANIEEV